VVGVSVDNPAFETVQDSSTVPVIRSTQGVIYQKTGRDEVNKPVDDNRAATSLTVLQLVLPQPAKHSDSEQKGRRPLIALRDSRTHPLSRSKIGILHASPTAGQSIGQ
jgi:hypothetical protein